MSTEVESPKRGRPSIFTQELAAEICRRISEGESLRQVCRDESMPSTTTVMRWARTDADFRKQYAQAREDLLEHWAEEINEISDDGSNDWMDRELANGHIERVLDHEHVSRSKLRVDTRKWLLSKLAPRVYGDRGSLELTGKDGAPLIPPTDEVAVARRIAFLFQQGAAALDKTQA
jgi:hypothetical protein